MTLGRKTGGRKARNLTHCEDCGENLDLNPVIRQGYRLSFCRLCMNKRYQGRYKEYRDEYFSRPENKLRKYENSLVNLYGLSVEDYKKLLDFQSGVCAICKEEPDREYLDVDHDHTTGDVRGLLCRRCNLIIGRLNEDPKIIQGIYDYLDRTTWNKGLELVKIGKKA